MTRLLTAQQACDRFGIPGERTLRTMRQQGLAAVRLGRAYLYDESDVADFIESRKCRARTEAHDCIGSPRDRRSISSGMTGGESAFAQQARQTAAKLKRRLPGSSDQATVATVHAIHTK